MLLVDGEGVTAPGYAYDTVVVYAQQQLVSSPGCITDSHTHQSQVPLGTATCAVLFSSHYMETVARNTPSKTGLDCLSNNIYTSLRHCLHGWHRLNVGSCSFLQIIMERADEMSCGTMALQVSTSCGNRRSRVLFLEKV